jgi:hypothetical protein
MKGEATMYRDRVEKGAALLDGVRPGWAGEIATDRLAMETCNKCVLGQLYGDYQEGWFRVLEPLPASRLFSAAAHGFTLYGTEQDTGIDPRAVILDRFAVLAEAWRAEVRRRLGEAERGS